MLDRERCHDAYFRLHLGAPQLLSVLAFCLTVTYICVV